MKAELQALRQELNERLDKLEQSLTKKPSYKVGAWNKDIESKIRIFITEVNKDGSLKGYGTDYSSAFRKAEDWFLFEHHRNGLIPMTQEEIIEMINAECKKRGIVEGATIERPEEWDYSLGHNRLMVLEDCNMEYHEGTDRIFIDSVLVYSSGQFAKVVKDEPKVITVNGMEVRYVNNSTIHVRMKGQDLYYLSKSHIETILKNFPS